MLYCQKTNLWTSQKRIIILKTLLPKLHGIVDFFPYSFIKFFEYYVTEYSSKMKIIRPLSFWKKLNVVIREFTQLLLKTLPELTRPKLKFVCWVSGKCFLSCIDLKKQFLITILVTGAPNKPKGPLQVSDVNAEGCKLKWEPPEDDGGAPVDYYSVERMDVDSGHWIPVATTKTPQTDVICLVLYSLTLVVEFYWNIFCYYRLLDYMKEKNIYSVWKL